MSDFCITAKQSAILSGLRVEIWPSDKGVSHISVYDGGRRIWEGDSSGFDKLVADMAETGPSERRDPNGPRDVSLPTEEPQRDILQEIAVHAAGEHPRFVGGRGRLQTEEEMDPDRRRV